MQYRRQEPRARQEVSAEDIEMIFQTLIYSNIINLIESRRSSKMTTEQVAELIKKLIPIVEEAMES